MAEVTKPPLSGPATAAPLQQRAPTTAKIIKANNSPPRRKYTMPLPVRTFPLPTFYPSNPVSLVHLAFAWLGQVLSPPPAEPATVYEGVWSPATRSVHVTDPKSMNDLWCQGFYGKGSLSRSEPNWLNREKARRGLLRDTSEQRTNRRREERADTKWERGRTELEAIEQRRRDEEAAEVAAKLAAVASTPVPSPSPSPTQPILFKAPVGPLELLALPNSEADLNKATAAATQAATASGNELHSNGSPNGTSETRAGALKSQANGSAPSLEDRIIHSVADGDANGHAETPETPQSAVKSNGDLANGDASTIEPLKRQKSVRFSPTVESTTFLHSDPPSPNHSSLALSPKRTAANGRPPSSTTGNGSAGASSPSPAEVEVEEIENREHLQLAPEEAFFLAYAVGALRVVDPATRQALTTRQLFALFRQHSHFPPRTLFSVDDPFLVHYAVYHHFRSLGWVPRHGIKFGVDWLLYGKGPALDHAEFGVMVMPSTGPAKSWHWLHSVNRVLSTVFKTLVLVYVEIPLEGSGSRPGPGSGSGPARTSDDDAGGVDMDNATAVLGRYRIREVVVRRWSSNRNRD